MNYKEIDGDLIQLALSSDLFDSIGHGVNCFCRMKRGIAPKMDAIFKCNQVQFFPLENQRLYEGDINKLGQVQFYNFKDMGCRTKDLRVFNLYTQYHWLEKSKDEIPLDYTALKLSL